MSEQTLTQEEYDIIVEDARFGDLDTLKEIFSEINPTYISKIKESVTQNTTIHMASANGHLEVITYLLSLLPKVDAKALVNSTNFEGNTSLHWATLNGHLSVVKYLIEEFDADPFIKNKFQHDAIFEAENSGKEEIETYLLQKFDVEPLEDSEGNVNIKISNNENNEDNEGTSSTVDTVEIKPGNEIESITKETLESLESNEDFLQKRTEKLDIN